MVLSGCSAPEKAAGGCALTAGSNDWASLVPEARPYTDRYLEDNDVAKDQVYQPEFSSGAPVEAVLQQMRCDVDDPYFKTAVRAAFTESFADMDTGPTATESKDTSGQVEGCPLIWDPEAAVHEAAEPAVPYVQGWFEGHGTDLTAREQQYRDAAWYDKYGDDGTATKEIVSEMGCTTQEYSDLIVAEAITQVLFAAQQAAYEATKAPSSGGEGGGDIPDVDVPDVNPFYCSWSFRGGFNCGVHG
ncbi:hypothetical protein [Leifsonia sp. Leaf264]|uniref:hypothetical protein n=1 Tax=Leifsonia sp. Leaf264 TaxID=1736314 RepID=UPI0012FAB175|nr:hypothetical protein [Leifsonia sp. Leaf264]